MKLQTMQKNLFENEDFIFEEIDNIEEITDSNKTFEKLKQINWDFEDADTTEYTHNIHPYPAKYIPQLPYYLIGSLSLRGETILDPFGGSGTTALEAIRLGRPAISLDANPLSQVIGKAKTGYLENEEIESIKGLQLLIKNANSEILNAEILHDELEVKYKSHIPEIPNMDKWFTLIARSELAMIKSFIETITINKAKNVALTAFLKVVMKVCNQESETRYSSTEKNIEKCQVLKLFSKELDVTLNKVIQSTEYTKFGVVDFRLADAMNRDTWKVAENSVSLIVTSPPYPNAYDYHLYHRFRIFWLGNNPTELRKVEIGSHLRHQSKKNGFEAYLEEMRMTLQNMFYALQPGRYAVLVVGNGIYKGIEYETGKELLKLGEEVGFENVGRIERNLPKNKRSVTSFGRRLMKEDIIVLKKPEKQVSVKLINTNYNLANYEKELQLKELKSLIGISESEIEIGIEPVIKIDSNKLPQFKKLTFMNAIRIENSDVNFNTWQSYLESTLEELSNRKEPKYVTHGIHSYKGKFYPQLAKSLINISKVKPGSVILDPFMGSSTVLLEAYLNGFKGVGMDMNPLAYHIGKAKLGILKENPELIKSSVTHVINKIDNYDPNEGEILSEFLEICHEEIQNWFPINVIPKLNYLLRIIRNVGSPRVVNFLEVCLSDIVRSISNQDPKDLRIRKRNPLIEDAPVFELFIEKVNKQLEYLNKYWEIISYCPNKSYDFDLSLADNRELKSFINMGLEKESVDLVVTSPPYFTALPYIDTDRLSLLTILGIPRKENIVIERNITGSREITKKQKEELEQSIDNIELPDSVNSLVEKIQTALELDKEAGFRRKNMPSLIVRYFRDMDHLFENLYYVMKKNSLAWIVIGNNKTKINGQEFLIDSVSLLKDIAISKGFILYDEIDITVTTENLKHIKNAITENGILGFKKV